MSDELLEFYLDIKWETQEGRINEGAFLTTDGENEIWLPKSKIDWSHVKGSTYLFYVPYWLAEKKEMI